MTAALFGDSMLPESCPFLYELFSKSVFLKTKESTVKGVAFDKMLLSDGFWPVTIITPDLAPLPIA